MKSTLLSLLLLTNFLFANNEIYLEQNGSTGTFNITQIGSANKFGTSTEVSSIDGDDNFFDISQIGNGNQLDINWEGGSNFFGLYLEGDSNTKRFDIIGDQNTFSTIILGSGNSYNVSKDRESNNPGNNSQSLVDTYVSGFTNIIDLYLDNNVNALSKINLLGNGNSITSIQEGGNLGLGHSQTLNIQGDGNIIEIAQSGAEGHILQLTHFGNDSNFTIIQSDGLYSGGLEGLGIINTFDGAYIHTGIQTRPLYIEP